jgi:hypothetical protein
MTKTHLIFALMALVAVMIIGIAAFVFTHLSSGISLTQSIILIAIAVVGLFVIMGIIVVLMRSLTAKK